MTSDVYIVARSLKAHLCFSPILYPVSSAYCIGFFPDVEQNDGRHSEKLREAYRKLSLDMLNILSLMGTHCDLEDISSWASV